MNKQNLAIKKLDLTRKIKARDKKKMKKMQVTGLGVKKLQRIIKNK